MKKFLSILLVSLMLLGLILPAVAEELSSGEDFNHQSAEIDSLNSLNSEEEQTFGDNQTSMRNGLIGEESYEDLRESNEPQSGNELHMQENDSPTEKEKNAEENSGDGPAPLESDLLSDASAETIKESDDYPNSKESDLQGNSLSDSNDQMDFTSPEGDLEGNDPQEELGDSTFDLSSVDYEMTVGKSISETLNIDKKKATIGLKVETTGSLLFSVKGGVKVTLYSLQNERMIVLSCAKYQDIEWDEKTALFDAIPGYYYSVVELQDGEEDASFICSVTAVQNDNDENVDNIVRANTASEYNGYLVDVENDSAELELTDSEQSNNQAILIALNGSSFDALMDIKVTGFLGSELSATVKSDSLKGESGSKYRVIRLLSANEAKQVSETEISDNGELAFSINGDGIYTLVRMKGIELDPSKLQGSPAFFVEVVSGAKRTGEDYVWVANTTEKGHRFIFRINYRFVVYTDQNVDQIHFVIPEQILRDRNRDFADSIEFSVPSEEDIAEGGEFSEDVYFAWRQETTANGEPTGNIIIYNFRPITNGTRNGSIELAYLTSKTSFEYRDYNSEDPASTSSDPFHCVLKLQNKLPVDSEYIPVHIDTTAQVTYIEKGGKDASWLYDSWQPGWGDQSEFRIPSNDTGKYIVWQLKLKVSSTQPYHLVIEDIPETEGVEAVAFKWIGQDTKFNKPNSNNSWRWDNQEKDLEMYAYVITRVDESIYKELISGQEVKKWTAVNRAVATAIPIDEVDSPSIGSDTASFTYEYPLFYDPTGHFDAWKRGDGSYRSYGARWNEWTSGSSVIQALSYQPDNYSRYDLEQFGVHNGVRGELNSYDNLDYAVWMWGTPYVLTKDYNYSFDVEKNYGYFRDYVIFDQWDFDVKLGQSASDLVSLGLGDYRIKQIKFNVIQYDYKLNSSGLGFEYTSFRPDRALDENDLQGGIGDVLHIYGKTGNGEWVEILRKDYRSGGSTWVNSEYASLTDDKTIAFAESADHSKDILLYRTVMKTRHGYVTIGTVPEYELFSSDTVLNIVNEAGTLCLFNDTYADLYSTWEGQTKHVEYDENNNVIDTYYTGDDYSSYRWDDYSQMNIDLGDNDDKIYYRYFHVYDAYRRDYDYARTSESNSDLVKRVTSTSNDTRMQQYTIGWQVDMRETISTSSTSSIRIEKVPQDSGVFYDLLPKGASVNVDTVVVMASGNEMEHRVELISNWRGSGRTMMKVTVLESGTDYSLSYDTIHSWESIKDYGSDVYNPVAYETGNDSIANGKPDDASGYLSIGTTERSWMKGLDPECGDSLRFLYSEARTQISALVALSNGTTKKVKTLKESAFKSITSVEQEGVYTYQLSYMPDSKVRARNLLFIDNIEDANATGRQWQGKLYTSDPAHPENAIDVTQLKAAGANPTVYCSDHIVELGNYSGDQSTESYLSERGFLPFAEFMISHTLEDVKAIAVYCGDNFEMKGNSEQPNKSLTVLLYMISPEYVEEKGNPYPATFNNFSFAMRVGIGSETGALEYIPIISTTPDVVVYFHIAQNIPLQKISSENETVKIDGVKFKLSGKSFYTGNQVEHFATTSSDGKLLFASVERGCYYLEEVESPKEWVLKRSPKQVIIDGYGRLWIADLDQFLITNGEVQTDPSSGKPLMTDGTVATDQYMFATEKTDSNIFTVENDPRVYADFSFYKIGKHDGRPIEGTEFRIEGYSHYNNDIDKTAVSDVSGIVRFDDIEWGVYTLKETQAADGYNVIPSDVEIRVEVDGNGIISVYEYDSFTEKAKEHSDWIIIDRMGDISILNPERCFDIDFSKAELVGDSYRWLPGAKFSLKGTSTEGTKLNLEAISDKDGIVLFTGVEEGTYELNEVEPPKNIRITDNGEAEVGGEINYQGDPNTYLLTVSIDGSFVIRKKVASGEGAECNKDSLNRYVFLNTPMAEGELIITKKWEDGLSGTSANNRPYPALTLLTKESFASNYYTIIFDAHGGYFPTGGKTYSLRFKADELPTAEQAASVPTPLRNNYVFEGWVYKLTGNNSLLSFSLDSYTERATIIVYAKWTPSRSWDFSFKGTDSANGTVQKFTVPVTGTYQFEAWGASGGNPSTNPSGYGAIIRNGGKGAYTSGTIQLEAGQTIYVYVGGRGEDGPGFPRGTAYNGVAAKGGWNGGAEGWSDTVLSYDDSAGGGGGATDFRITGGSWSAFESLKSRIMVAGGGGGATDAQERMVNIVDGLAGQKEAMPKWTKVPGLAYYYKASISAKGEYEFCTLGYSNFSSEPYYSEVSGPSVAGSFGSGGSRGYNVYDLHSTGGGGGGWYGGVTSRTRWGDIWGDGTVHAHDRAYGAGGSGGTSYISGHEGCYAIDQTSSQGNITHLSTSEFSGYVFSDTIMLAGYELGSHPNPDSSGNGYARITYVVPSDYEDGEVYPEQILVPASGSSSGSEEEIRSLNSMDEFDGEGNATSGYWEKTSDDTWLYHFKVVDPKQDYVVFENAGLVYSTYNYKYESEQMTPGFVELPGEKTSATITNRLPTGNLNVTKHISGGTSEQKFRFTIKMTDVSNRPINGVYSGVSFQNGEAVFWLSDGESKMIEGLPAGYHYLVDETEVPYYSKSFEPEIPSGTIVANSVADITCTNTYTPPILNPVNVGLRKVETGCFEIAGTYVLRADFRNLIPNTLYSYSIVDERMTFTSDGNGEYYGLQVKLKNEDMAVFERLPVGAQYKFSEPGGDYTASYQIVDLAGGTKINQSASLSPVSGSELSTAWETVDQNEKVIVNFENLLKRTARLSIKKVVEGLDTGTGYEISILLSNLTAGSKYTAVKGTDNPFVWTANSAGEIIRTLSFQNNEEIEIKGLPVGTKYRVAEATSDGYIPSIFIDESQITLVQTTQSEGFVDGIGILEQTLHEGSDVNVVVKNARKTGSLRLHKIVEGTSTTEETQFNFTIALTYFKNREKIAMIDTESITATLNGEPLSLNFIDGKCIVSLKDQDVLTIEGIYDGVQYEITEEENASYRASIQGNQSGTIRYCENEEVTEIVFTNTYVSPEPSPSTPTPSPSTPPHDPNVPSTGDESSLWLLSMITLFCISVIAALIVIPQIVVDKRKREGSSTTK